MDGEKKLVIEEDGTAKLYDDTYCNGKCRKYMNDVELDE